MGFACFTLLYLGLLLAPWPGRMAAYSTVFQAEGNLLCKPFGKQCRLRFIPPPPGAPAQACQAEFTNRKVNASGTLPLNTHQHGYAPTAVVVALVLATPIPWRRRWRALLWGVLAVQGFVALRVSLLLLEWISGDNPIACLTLSPFWAQVLNQALAVLVKAPPSVYVVPLFIWIVVTLRRADFERWLGPQLKPQPVKTKPTNTPARRET